MKVVDEFKRSCSRCMQMNMCFMAKSPLTQALLKQSGPDDFVAITTAKDPLICLVMGQTGSVFVENPHADFTNDQPQYVTAYLLVVFEVLTYTAHILPLHGMDTVSTIQELE